MSTDSTRMRDEKEFEKWENEYTSKCCVHPDMFTLIHENRKAAWKAALVAERARSKCLVEALNKIGNCPTVLTIEDAEYEAREALKSYGHTSKQRGEG